MMGSSQANYFLQSLMRSFSQMIDGYDDQDFLMLPSNEHHSSQDFNIPVFTTRASSEDGFIGTIDFPDLDTNFDSVSRLGSSLVSLKISHKMQMSFKHDFVFSIISKESDVKLSSVYGFIHDGFDNLSPDWIVPIDDWSIVLEFSTRKGRNVRNLHIDFENKRAKYEQCLKNRARHCEMKIAFFILCINEESCVSNFSMDQDLIDELIFRYRLSNAIEVDLISKALLSDNREKDLVLNEKLVKSIFSTQLKYRFIEEEADKPLKQLDGAVWSEANYNELFDPANLLTVNQITRSCLRRSMKENYRSLDLPSRIRTESGVKYQNKEIVDNFNELDQKILESVTESEDRTRSHKMKPAVQLPYWRMEQNMISNNNCLTDSICILTSDIEELKEELGHDLVSEVYLWQQSTIWIINHQENFTNVEIPDLKTEEEWNSYLDFFNDPDEIRRSKYHRVVVEENNIDKFDLAVRGIVIGKGSILKNDLVEEVRARNNNPFSWHAETTDLDLFFEDIDCMEYMNNNAIQRDLLSLIKKGHTQHCNTNGDDKVTNLIQSFTSRMLKDPEYNYYKMVSDIGVELTLSLKQHCKSSEFIIKKLLWYDVWMLIKPTNSTSHCFVSFLTKSSNILMENKDYHRTVFKNYTEVSGYCITKFVSFNQSKLVNLVNCESRFVSSISFLMDTHGCKPYNTEIFDTKTAGSNRLVWKDLRLIMLTHLSDKDEVEDELTRLRYIMMEGFVFYPNVPKPSKMLSKVNKIPRSRLTVFIIKRLLMCIKRIEEGYHFFRNSEPSSSGVLLDRNTRWSNLFHPIWQTTLNDPGNLINFFYLGYVNNKNKLSEKNVEGKLYIKILEMEEKFLYPTDTDEIKRKKINGIGVNKLREGEDTYHYYDVDLLKHMSLEVIKKAKSIHGQNFLDTCESEILRSLANLKIESSMSTLKASSNFNESMENFKYKQEYHRSKVIERTMKEIDGEILVMDLIPKCLAELEKKNCMHIDLFKKNQFGGLREIYVLGFQERVCQLVLETISRSICSFFKSETMTHPNSKRTIPEIHTKETNQTFEREKFIIMGTSDDAEKWNQGHYSSKFYQLLCLFTPVYMHGFIHRILRLWMRKRIKISQDLLDIFESNKDLIIENPIVNKMYRVHKGYESIEWMETGKSFIETRTGMMQGILHYTSSLLHTIVQEYVQSETIRLGRTLLYSDEISGDYQKSKKLICSVMQSSDDSSMLISMPVSDAKQLKLACQFTSMIFKFKNLLSRYVGIYPSVKSTQNTPFVMEFNSNFYFDNSKYMASIKSVFASINVSEQESMQGRQEEASTMLTDCVSTGVSFSVINMIQVAQLLLHYRILGSSVNKFFLKFCDNIKELPDPASGFFLMDNNLCPGIFGYRYNLWKNVTVSKTGDLYHQLLSDNNHFDSVTKDFFNSTDTFDVLHAGSMSRKIILPFGNRKKWERLIQSSGLDNTWIDKINEEPIILYRNARSPEELQLKFAIKLNSPGVSKAFDTGNVLPRMISSSVYILNYKVLQPLSAWYEKPQDKIQGTEDKTLIWAKTDICKTESGDYIFERMSADRSAGMKYRNIVITNKDILVERYIGHCISKDNAMSKGFALELATKCPYIKKVYGELGSCVQVNSPYSNRVIFNLVSKETYFQKPRKGYSGAFETSFRKMIEILIRDEIRDVHIPLIGTGLDMLSYSYVMGVIIKESESYQGKIYIHLQDKSYNYQLAKLFPYSSKKINYENNKKFSLLSCTFENMRKVGQTITEAEMNFLFPFHKEYIEKDTALRRLDNIVIDEKIYQLRRTTTNINVLETENSLIFKPEQIIGEKWFNLKHVPISGRVLNDRFEDLRTHINWLSDDPEETLRKSPFDSHLQLHNWLARNDIKDRVINISGAPLIARSHGTNLINAILQNYSNLYKLKYATTLANVSSKTNTDLKHQIYMTLESPLKEHVKEDLVIRFLQRSENIDFSKNRFNSRSNILSIIQDVADWSVKKDPDEWTRFSGVKLENIINKIKSNRLGVIGAYKVPQKYSEKDGTYIGRGIWSGMISGADVSIFIDNINSLNSVVGVIIRSEELSDIKSLAFDIMNWSKEHSVNCGTEIEYNKVYRYGGLFHESLKQAGATYDRSLNKMSIVPKNKGYPVFRSSRLKSIVANINYDNLSIKVTGMNIYLQATMYMDDSELKALGKNFNKKTSKNWKKDIRAKERAKRLHLNILKYHASSNDFSRTFSGLSKEDDIEPVIRSFIMNEGLEPETARSFINKMRLGFESDDDLKKKSLLRNIDESLFRLWLKNLFVGAMGRHSIFAQMDVVPPELMAFTAQTDPMEAGILDDDIDFMLGIEMEEDDPDKRIVDFTNFMREFDQTDYEHDYLDDESQELSDMLGNMLSDITAFGETRPRTLEAFFNTTRQNKLLEPLVNQIIESSQAGPKYLLNLFVHKRYSIEQFETGLVHFFSFIMMTEIEDYKLIESRITYNIREKSASPTKYSKLGF